MIWYEMSYNQPVLSMGERLKIDFEEQDKVFAYLDKYSFDKGLNKSVQVWVENMEY